MKKITLLFLSLLSVSTIGFSENLVLENQTSYPTKSQTSKVAIQWADSAKEVEEGNNAFTYGAKLNSASIQVLTQTGKIDLIVPEKAEYFRILVWSMMVPKN